MDEYRGKCPRCGNALAEAEGGTYLDYVPHYRIRKTLFEAAWDQYESGVGKLLTAEALHKYLSENNERIENPIPPTR